MPRTFPVPLVQCKDDHRRDGAHYLTLRVQCALLFQPEREHMVQANGIFAGTGFKSSVSIKPEATKASDMHSSCIDQHSLTIMAEPVSLRGRISPGGAVMLWHSERVSRKIVTWLGACVL